MSDPDRAREPSMEEILASIRRIISDDKKNQRSEAGEDPASTRAGGMFAGSESAERDEMGGRRAPVDPFAEADVLSDVETTAPGRIRARFEDTRAEEPAASFAEAHEPEAAPAEEAAGRFAEPEAGYEDAPEPAPEAGLRGRSEEDLDAAFALRRGHYIDQAHRPDVDPRAEEPAMEEPAAAEEPAATEEPLAAEEAAAAEEPAAMDEPVAEEEPAMEEAAPIEEASRLISSGTDASVASAFDSLENFVLSTHSRTLEDLVSEMLRPLLKAWLDANLPPLVERLVREEIERVSRGRR